MKKIFSIFVIASMCLTMCPLVHAEREYVGTTTVKDNVVFINNNQIPSAQLPNGFVYLPVDALNEYGFDISLDETSGKKIYTVQRNDKKYVHPQITADYYPDTNVYTTDSEVYMDSDTPANVFELENGVVLIQSDELAKYGVFDWSYETHTIAINFENNDYLPAGQPFHNALGIEDIDEIAYGTIVLGKNRCADIEPDDLRNWLDAYWDFYCDRVIAPMSDIDSDNNYYFKLWNKDKTKSYTVYNCSNGVIAGTFGEPYDSNGDVKANYVWYKPYIGNARNALYSADTTLRWKYLDQSSEEYVGNERAFTSADENDIPTNQNNLLITTGCSEWAESEIQKAAADNLMLYDFSDKYTQDITRLDFCKLAYRLIATEFVPDSDSRMEMWSAVESIINERGLAEAVSNIEFTDCDYTEVDLLAAAGIVYGMGDGTFAPDSNITREQAAVILYRMAEFLGNKTIISPHDVVYYYDENIISDWAQTAVKSMQEMGIMYGTSDYDFSPQGTYTVEQAILTMLRLYECK